MSFFAWLIVLFPVLLVLTFVTHGEMRAFFGKSFAVVFVLAVGSIAFMSKGVLDSSSGRPNTVTTVVVPIDDKGNPIVGGTTPNDQVTIIRRSDPQPPEQPRITFDNRGNITLRGNPGEPTITIPPIGGPFGK
jgi:hypothetical protein